MPSNPKKPGSKDPKGNEPGETSSPPGNGPEDPAGSAEVPPAGAARMLLSFGHEDTYPQCQEAGAENLDLDDRSKADPPEIFFTLRPSGHSFIEGEYRPFSVVFHRKAMDGLTTLASEELPVELRMMADLHKTRCFSGQVKPRTSVRAETIWKMERVLEPFLIRQVLTSVKIRMALTLEAGSGRRGLASSNLKKCHRDLEAIDEVLSTVTRMENFCLKELDSWSKYHSSRAELMPSATQELNRAMQLDLTECLAESMTFYVSLAASLKQMIAIMNLP